VLLRRAEEQAIAQDRGVKQAQADLDRGLAEAAEVTAKWEQAIRDHYSAQQRFQSSKVDLSIDGELKVWLPDGVPNESMIRHLSEMADQANIVRTHTLEQLGKKRDQLERAKARVRRRLAA
jgi:hypothetical protein